MGLTSLRQIPGDFFLTARRPLLASLPDNPSSASMSHSQTHSRVRTYDDQNMCIRILRKFLPRAPFRQQSNSFRQSSTLHLFFEPTTTHAGPGRSPGRRSPGRARWAECTRAGAPSSTVINDLYMMQGADQASSDAASERQPTAPAGRLGQPPPPSAPPPSCSEPAQSRARRTGRGPCD